MPYVVNFTRPVHPTPGVNYLNACCEGSDGVLAAVLPALRARYGPLTPDQEDWGWYLWWRVGDARLAVDVHTHDAPTGESEIHLTTRRRRRWFGTGVADMPELEALRECVLAPLRAWPVQHLRATHQVPLRGT